MRILHVTPTYYPATRYGGPIRSVHGLCAALANLGHDVHVLTTNVDGNGESNVSLSKPCELDGVTIHYFPTGVGRRIYRSPRLRDWLDGNIQGFDVLHTHAAFLWTSWVCRPVVKRTGVPLVVSPRGMLVKELIRRKSRVKKTLAIQCFDRRLLAASSAVHVCSRIERNELSKFGFNLRDVVIIENGITPTGRCSRDNEGKGQFFLFLGRISWKKRLDLLISAIANVPKANLVVAGNDDEGLVPELMNLARLNGVHSRVKFVGEVLGDEKLALLASATALVVPSISENFANVVLEAMCAGTPVISTPDVGASELVDRHRCGIVSEGSVEGISSAILKLSEDASLVEEYGRRGRAAVEDHYTWTKIAQRFELLYREVGH